MNRKQRKAKRLRATQHTKLQAHAWKKYDTPCSDMDEAEEFWKSFEENPKPSTPIQKKRRNIGRSVLVACSIALVWLVVLWVK
ncbi:hypothetical protein [Acinetobacter rudis]|uniref:hypothetical protein n=1 Tax=Acinetobacter rudis TaxID=632955 RepID=UPI003341BDC2